jgi:hypothetical protein
MSIQREAGLRLLYSNDLGYSRLTVVLQNIQQKSPRGRAAVRVFLARTWRAISVGFLLGAVVGLVSSTMDRLCSRLSASALSFTNKHLGDIAVWPNHGKVTLFVILVLAAVFYTPRLIDFLKRLGRSWRAGLISGIGVIWFVTSALAFSLFNLTGSVRSLFLLGFAVIGTLTIFERDTSIDEATDRPFEADPDNPILVTNEDILGRGAVVDSLVRAIVSDRLPVVALTGDFGDGKTSVLNLLSVALDKRKDVLSVRFSPWLPMDQSTLVSTFFDSVLEKIETKLFVPRIKRNFVQFSRALFSVVPRLPVSLKDLFETPSQSKQIDELEQNLSRLPVRVAVLLDDMDRMHKDELDVLFKLIRGVPEFPHITYVCAFHPDALVQTQRSGLPEESRQEAQHFLEKFFPDRIALPKIEESLLADEFCKRLYAICDQGNLIMEPKERQEFQDNFQILWQSSIKGYLSNLRRLKLLTNRLARSLPLVGQEVNVRDFIVLELVRMIDPIVYEEIYRNPGYFMFAEWRTTTWAQIVGLDEEDRQKRRNDYFDSIFRNLRKPPEGTVLGLLQEIFPTVAAFLRGITVPARVAQNKDKAERERRVFHPDFFPRYFIMRVPHDLFGEEELSNFITAMNEKTDVTQCAAMFKSKYAELEDLPMKRWDFLRRVKSSINKFSPTATQALPIGISELSGKFDNDTSRSFDAITALGIVFAAANQLRGTIGVESVLAGVIRNAGSDQLATQLLNDVSNRTRVADLEDWRTIDKTILEKAFRKRMSDKYAPGGLCSFFPKNGPVNIVPLGRWAHCGEEGSKQVQEYLVREFQAEHSNIGKFLVCFFPEVPIDPIQDPRAQDPIGTIRKHYFPPEELIRLLNEYGDSAYSSPDEKRAIQEFRSQYNPSAS